LIINKAIKYDVLGGTPWIAGVDLIAVSSSAARMPGSNGNDEAALLRLWREKRGEAEPEALSGGD
jgi:hypothetical protein